MNRRQLVRGAAGAAGAAALAGLGAALLAGEATAAVPSSVLPSLADITATLRKVNDHWIGAHANPGDNKWARATYFSGNMALYRLTRVSRYLAYATSWAQLHNYGLNTGVTTRHADNHNAGQVYYDLNDVAPDPAKVRAINDSLSRMVNSTKRDDWWWVDALHMAMPCFVRASTYLGDPRFRSKMFSLYTFTKRETGGGLYDFGRELWYRDARFTPPAGITSPSGKPVFWSRGDGWALAAHAKVLRRLPTTDSHRPEYIRNLQAVSRSLRAVQRSDGFWNVNLGDPAHLPGPETSGTALFAFGMAFGIRTGLLDRATYLPVVARAWNGMVATAVHADGFLGFVQGVGFQPESSQPVTTNTTSDFGVGAFLLAGSEIARLTA